MSGKQLSMLLTVIICFHVCISDETYLGCFKEDDSNREFLAGGGAYNFNNINPKLCKALCKALDYQYAALQDGYQCLCGDVIETHSDGLKTGCTLRCAGNPTLTCGGYGYGSVFSTSTSVKTLEISDPDFLEVFKVNTIQITLSAGSDGAEYTFDFGDQTGIDEFSPGLQPHIYNKVGVYLIKAWARNEDSGLIEARREVFVEAPISDLYTKCDPFVEVDHKFRCSSKVGQGTGVQVTWNFNDGSDNVQMSMADATRFSIGPIIPRRLSRIEPPLGLDGIYIMPGVEISQDGTIEAWELFAVKAGQVLLQVYRPLCDTEERYCPYNRTCISRYWPCPPPTEQFCHQNTSAFCAEQGTCQLFEMEYVQLQANASSCSTTSSSVMGNFTGGIYTTPTPNLNNTSTNTSTCSHQSDSYYSVPKYTFGTCTNNTNIPDMDTPYMTVGETVVYLHEGYNMIPLNVSQRFKVRAHDWIGFTEYHHVYPPYYPKAAYPPVGEIAHYFDDDIHVLYVPQSDMQYLDVEFYLDQVQKINSVGLYLKAYISKPASSWVSHSYSSSGTFEVNTNYINNLRVIAEGPSRFVDSEYRILSIAGMQFTRDLGIYYACTNVEYSMHVEITQGTFVTFLWTFPDGSQNMSAPYQTNGIVDGPEVKTPDTLSYHFDVIGNYTTNVVAYNDINSAEIELFTIARYRILGLSGTIVLYPGDNTTNDWDLVLSGCWFNFSSFITQGNVVKYQWDHGDGSTYAPWSFDTIHEHYYSEPGDYTVDIQSDNIASILDHTFHVSAVKPNNVYLDAYATSEIQTLLFCEVTWHTGVGLEYHWDFGDGENEIIFDTGYVWHNYSTYNVYEVNCTIANFPKVNDINTIIVQDPVEGVVLQNKTKVEATGDEVVFNVTWTRGNDVHFDWDYGDGIRERTEIPTATHIYLIIGYFEILVNVSNVVSSMESNPIILEVQERLTSISVSADENYIVLYPVYVEVTITTGNKVWYDYDFGDSVRELMSPWRNESHVYEDPTTYVILVHAYNDVSTINGSFVVQIDSRITGSLLQTTTPQVRADALAARCIALNGSSVIMSYDWGDGSADGPYDATYHREMTLSDFTTNHTYETEGTFNITCYMENPWTSAYSISEVIVQEAITMVEFLPNVTVKGEIFNFEVLPFEGGSHSALFRWDYNDKMRFTTQNFIHQYVYRNAGMYLVSLEVENLISSFTTTQDIFVQEKIEGFTLLHEIQPVVPGVPTIITWQIAYGTDVIYTADLGDDSTPTLFDQEDIGNMYTLYYNYTTAGSYKVTIKAENKLNAMKVSDIAHVEFPIAELKAYIRGNSTTHTDRSSYIIMEIAQGTNVEYTCNYNDGALPIVTAKQYCKHMFIQLGPHIVTVSAKNHLSSATTLANETYNVFLPPIPHVITGLELDVAEANIYGEPTVYMLYRIRGNRFNCTWLFGDNATTMTDVALINIPVIHTYAEIGVYTIWVTCDNFYHPPVIKSAQVTIQVPPDGLNLTSKAVGQYNTDLMFNISLLAGTDVEAVLNFTGYGFKMFVNETDGFVVVPALYVNQSGWQEVTITAWNMVPPVLTFQQMIYIESQITGLKVWSDQPYVTVGSIVTFYAELNTGTNVTFEWSFGTNNVVETTLNSSGVETFDSKQYMYTELGLYALYVTVFNQVGVVTHRPVLVAVQDSVRGFSLVTNSPVTYPDGVITFTCYWDTTQQILPTNASVEIYFGDATFEQPATMCLDNLEPISLFRQYNDLYTIDGCDGIGYYNPFCNSNFTEQYMVGTKLNILTVNHTYTPGTYTFSLKVFNLASKQIFKKTVETQVPMVNLSIITHNAERPGILHGDAGGGPSRNYYPLEYPVHFQVKLSRGTGNRYLWRLGDGRSQSTTDDQIEYQYYRPKSYEVRLLATNVFGMSDAVATVVLQESVVGLFAAHSGSTPANTPVTVILFATQVGSLPTFTLYINEQDEQHDKLLEDVYVDSNHTSNFTTFNDTLSNGTSIDPTQSSPKSFKHAYIMDKPVSSRALIDEALRIIDPNIYIPFDPYTQAVALHTLEFEEPGEYMIKIEGVNYASSSIAMTTVHITQESCQLPHIFIYGGSKNISSPWQVRKNHEIMLISDVMLNCSSTYTASFHWAVYQVAFYNGKPLPPSDLYRYDLPKDIQIDESDLAIPRRIMDYGTYLFQLTVTMDNDGKVSNKNQTYVEVIQSPLFARIAGGLSVTVNENETLVLNASQSFDPDAQVMVEVYDHSNQTFGADYDQRHGLTFQWYCKLHPGGSFAFEHGYDSEVDSCMEDSPAVLASSTPVFIMPLKNLTVSEQYVFAVIVSKDGRQDVMAMQEIIVLPGEPPHLDIRCVRNCKEKVNPQKPLALAVDCSNCVNGTAINYQWIIADDSGLEMQDDPFFDNFITGHKTRYLIVEPALFRNITSELLSISIRGDWSYSRAYGLAKEEFAIGGIPTQGICTIKPEDGVALQTDFLIDCSGFNSEEIPLHYEFFYSTGQPSLASVSSHRLYKEETGVYTLLFHSPEGKSPMITFPMGLRDRHYILDIKVVVRDAIGAEVEVDSSVQVFPPDSATVDLEISSLQNELNTSDTISTLDLLLGKGDTQAATKLLTTLATVMNEEEVGEDVEESSFSEAGGDDVEDAPFKTKVRALLVQKLSEIPVHNLDSTKQKSAAITQAVLKPDELDQQTQQTAADAYLEMLDILDEEAKEGTNLDAIEDVSQNFFSGAFNLLEAASGKASGFYKELQDDPKGWNDFWTAKEKALNETEIPKDVPTSLGLVSDVGEDVNVPDMDELENEPWVPEELRMSRNVTRKVFQIIDRITSTLLRNKLPGEPALVIQTDKLSLILKKENLEEKSVRFYYADDGAWFKIPAEALEITKEISNEDSVISQLFSSPDNPFSWHLSAYEVKTSVIGLALKDSEGNPLLVSGLSSAIEMLIPPTDNHDSVQDLGTANVGSKEFSFFHFNLSDSHTSIHIDITPTDGSSKQLTAWLRFGFWPTEKVYDLKISLPHPQENLYSSVYNSTTNITTNPYTWFIAENELFATGSYYIGVKVKQTEINREFLSRGMNITVPEEFVNVNVKIYTARCLYWSEAYEQWFPFGCEVGTLTTAEFTHCLCNHLTSFGGSFLVPPKKQLFIEDEVIIFIQLEETMLVLYVVAGTGGLMLICLLFAFICDQRHKKRIFGGIKHSENCYIVKVFTGMEYTASTTAKVFIVLYGADGSSNPCQLINKDNLSLRSGCIDTYMIATKKKLANLTGISLFHDGEGFSPTWHISRILIEEFATGCRYHFLCNAQIKQSSIKHTFQTATSKTLAGKWHLFDTAGTSERFGKLVPVWYLMTRPLLGWLSSAECVSTIFSGIFASMLGVVALNEFIFPAPISQPQEPSWIPEIDEIMTGVQAIALSLPLQYILLATFSSVQRKIPSSRITEEDRDGPSSGVFEEDDIDAVKTEETERRRMKKVKKQESLEEVTVETQQEETKEDKMEDSEPKKQTSLHEIKVEVPEISMEETDGGTESNAEDDSKTPDTPHFDDNASDIQDEGTQLEKLNMSMLAPPDALHKHRIRRSLRHLGRPSLRNTTSMVQSSASLDSFATVAGGDDEDSDSIFGSMPDMSSFSSMQVENVGNINQNASHISDFNPMELPDVVLTTRSRNGPTRWSLLRHRKQSQTHLQEMPEPLLYGGDYGKQMKNGESAKKPAARKMEASKNQAQQLKASTREGKTMAKRDVGKKATGTEKFRSKTTKVETLGSSSERNGNRNLMSQYPSTSKASCCTILIEYLVQFLSKTCLPWCCGFLLWPLALILLGGSGFLTIFLTFAYHEGLVIKWILAVAVSVIISNILVQPLLGILISVFGCICQKPGSLSTTSALFELRHKFKYTKTPAEKTPKTDASKSKLLHRQNLQTSPINRTGLKPRLKVLMLVVFMAITLYVVYSRHDPNMFYWNQTVQDMFVNGRKTGTRGLSKVHTGDQFWDWTNHTLLPSLSVIMDAQPMFQHLVLLQMPRLRQFRVQQTLPDKCPKMNIFQHWITQDDSCQTTFSVDNEDTRPYQEGWHPSPSGSGISPNGYQYFTTEELEGVSYTGLYASYSGGGYVAHLGRTSQSIQDNINQLSSDKWIHANTKAVLLEFIIFNSQVNLTSMVQVALEMLPTSVADSHVQIMTVTDLNVYGIMWWILSSLNGLFCIIAAIKIGLGTASILEHGREYFSTFPHLLSLLDVILSISGAAFVALEFLSQESGTSIKSRYLEVTQTYYWQDLTSAILACVVFIASLNVLLFLRVFKVFEIPINILQKVWVETCSASPMYMFAIMTFAYPGWFLFNAVTGYFHTIWKSVQSLHNLLLGGLYWDTTEPVMPYFIMCFLVLVNFITLLAFSAVIIQTYKLAKVQEILDQFINFGRLSKLAITIRHRIVTTRILRNVRLRKAIIAWGWRRGRNDQEPVSYDVKLRQIQERAQMLLQRVQSENDILFSDADRLVLMSQMIVQKLHNN